MFSTFQTVPVRPGTGLRLPAAVRLPTVTPMRFDRHVENLIAALRGLPEDKGRSNPREPHSSEKLMEQVLERYRLLEKTPEQTILENWASLVGPANAEYSRLMRIDESRQAIVGVTNPVVRQELFFHRREVLERIRALPGCGRIAGIRFRAG